MEKYLIEYIKGAVGSPSFERVTLLNKDGSKVSSVSGDCDNLRDLPIYAEMLQADLSSFRFVYKGEFIHQYQWQNFKKEWINCDYDKAVWCEGKGKLVRIKMIFIK